MIKVGVVMLLLLSAGAGLAVEPRQTEGLTTQSVLWKISGNGLSQPSYVFASWHLLCRNEIIFKNKVKLAISETEQLLFQNYLTYLAEEDYFDRQKSYAQIDRGRPIYQIEDRASRKKLLKLIDQKMDLKPDRAKRVMPVVKRMTPFEVFFSSMHSFIKDCRRLGSFDALLYDHYTNQGAEVGAFNAPKVFYEAMLASGFVDVESLIAYLENLDSQQAMVLAMKKHYYLDEDLTGLKQLYRIFLTNDHTLGTDIDRHILGVDTAPWVKTMVTWMHHKPTFISVHANYLHHRGEGVIERLEQLGYEVEPVN